MEAPRYRDYLSIDDERIAAPYLNRLKTINRYGQIVSIFVLSLVFFGALVYCRVNGYSLIIPFHPFALVFYALVYGGSFELLDRLLKSRSSDILSKTQFDKTQKKVEFYKNKVFDPWAANQVENLGAIWSSITLANFHLRDSQLKRHERLIFLLYRLDGSLKSFEQDMSEAKGEKVYLSGLPEMRYKIYRNHFIDFCKKFSKDNNLKYDEQNNWLISEYKKFADINGSEGTESRQSEESIDSELAELSKWGKNNRVRIRERFAEASVNGKKVRSRELNVWLNPKIERLTELYDSYLYRARLADLTVWYFVEFEEILEEIETKFDYTLDYNEDYKRKFHKYWNYAVRRRENFVPPTAKLSTPNITTTKDTKFSDNEPTTRNESEESSIVSSEDFFDKLLDSKDRTPSDNSKVKNEIGLAGELFYLNILEEDLKDLGVEGFPIHVSVEKGDRHGFDIASINSVGDRVMIEVKTTTQGKETPFYLTRNEYKVLKKHPKSYQIVRIYDFDLEHQSGRYFIIHGLSEFEQICEMEEETFELVEDTQIYLFD